MQPDEALELVAYLKAAYERERISQERLSLTANLLADVPYGEAREAVEHLIATEQYFPVVSQLRRCIAERRLGLPDSAAAWELADAWARNRPPVQPCPVCGTTATPGYEDFQADLLCGTCRGVGTVPDRDHTVRLPGPVLRAAELVGGKAGIRDAGEQLPFVRSQFTKAYLQFRDEVVQAVQVPAHLQLAAAARREALPLSMPMPALPSP